jgi:hypothetical protein
MTIKTASDIVATKLDNEVTILNINTGKYYALNEIGTRIWELIPEYGETEAILKILINEFNADASVMRRDLLGLINHLVSANLVSLS